MKRSWKWKMAASVLSVFLLLTWVNPALAAEQSKTIKGTTKLGSVTLKSNVSAEVQNLNMMPSENGQIVGFTLTVHNNSNKEINFIDYGLNLYSKSGTKFSVKSVEKAATKIPAKSSVDMTFYSHVSASLKATDLVIKIIEWNFDAQNYEKELGEITVPASYSTVTPTAQKKIMSAEGSELEISIQRSYIGKSEKYYRPDIKIAFKNVGKKTVTLPEYEISVITNDQLVYPLTAKDLKGTVLSPLSEKEFQLTASIPSEVKEGKWKLVITTPAEEGKVKIPVSMFELPDNDYNGGEEAGKFYTFTNTNGVYQIRLDSMNRLPLEDNDLVIANLTIANTGTDSLPLPNLTAAYTFNDTIKKQGTVSTNDRIISIAPGSSIRIQAVGSIPYTFDITKVNLIIQQMESGEGNEQELLDLVEFTHTGVFDKVPEIQSTGHYNVEDIGYRAELSVQSMVTFEGTSANILAAELSVKNLEKRLSSIQKLAGYFEKQDGTVYPATILTISDKINPGGKGLVYATATLPKGEDIASMKLVVGKAVETGTGENTKLVGYVNPQSFVLPEEKKEQNNLQGINLGPYKLSIERVATKARFDASSFTLEFDYELEQDLLVRSSLNDPKIIIQLKDKSKNTAFTSELTIAKAGEEGSNSKLEFGKDTVELSWQDDKVLTGIDVMKEFDLNIYLQIEPGYKKLLATHTIPWLVDRTLK